MVSGGRSEHARAGIVDEHAQELGRVRQSCIRAGISFSSRVDKKSAKWIGKQVVTERARATWRSVVKGRGEECLSPNIHPDASVPPFRRLDPQACLQKLKHRTHCHAQFINRRPTASPSFRSASSIAGRLHTRPLLRTTMNARRNMHDEPATIVSLEASATRYTRPTNRPGHHASHRRLQNRSLSSATTPTTSKSPHL